MRENWSYTIYEYLPGGRKNGAIEVVCRICGEDLYTVLKTFPPRLIGRRFLNGMVIPQNGWFERLSEDGAPDHILDALILYFQKRMGKGS